MGSHEEQKFVIQKFALDISKFREELELGFRAKISAIGLMAMPERSTKTFIQEIQSHFS